MRTAAAGLTDEDLRLLDALVERALASGEEEGLPILGYGEISLVLGWPADDPRFACKRLPAFDSLRHFEAYRDTLADYLLALRSAGLRLVETEMRAVVRDDGTASGYVVQPMLAPESLAPEVLRGSDPARGHPLVGAVVEAAARAVGPRVGLDAQLANWTWEEEGLTYLDLSTPLLWTADGRSRLDLALLARAYPAVLRWPLRRLVAPGILDTYRNLRKVYFDLCGNLLKQRLGGWLPSLLEQVNPRIEEPISEDDARRYYRSDARLWDALLRIRKLDRAWRRRVRRRPYPFLLPGRIER